MLVKLQKLYGVDRHGKVNVKYVRNCEQAVAACVTPPATVTVETRRNKSVKNGTWLR
jgi:hypothetical protein